MKFVVWISGIEQPKIVHAATWLRIDDGGVMFRDGSGNNIGTVQGTFAVFEAVDKEDV